MRRPKLASLLAVTLAVSALPLARAQTNATPRDTARELANSAANAIARGEHAAGEELLARAYQAYPAPTIALLHARTLAFLGRLSAAVAAYERAMRASLAPDAPDAFRAAVASAERELSQLRPRVPRLQLSVRGDQPEALRLELDGQLIPNAQLGRWLLADPGRRRLRVEANGSSYERVVRLEERQAVVVEITEPRSSAIARYFTLGAFGVGAIGVGTGIVTGLMASSAHQQARAGCPAERCVIGSEGARDAERYRDLRVVSTISYAVGGVGLGLGGILLLRGSFDGPSWRVELEAPGSTPIALQ
jgi:tetratricopeptide (TPR) repeat protein